MRKLFKLLDAIRNHADRVRMIQKMDVSRDPASADPDMWWRFGIGEPPGGWPERRSKKLSKAA